MTASNKASVPVWALATDTENVPNVFDSEGMTPERLGELRTVLAALAKSPIATLEAHPIVAKRDKNAGIPLHATSPLAQQLAQLMTQTAKSAPPAVNVADSGEVLYRMVVPAKVAAQFGKGLVKPMASKSAAGGIHGALRDSQGIVAAATFVPVTGKATAIGGATGATTSSATTAGLAVTGAGVMTVAAPLVLMALAIGVSAYADQQRQKAITRITTLLEEIQERNLEAERNALDGCRDAIDKATSVLLDQGKIGLSLGLDSSSYAISIAIESAQRRLEKWQAAINKLPEGPVELSAITKAFAGIDRDGGLFRAHLELARLAISLKRRVLVLQAVEHAQLEGSTNPFKSFLGSLQEDERRVDELESGIATVLLQISALELKSQSKLSKVLITQGTANELLKTAYRLREFGTELNVGAQYADVSIEIERNTDGSLVVFPATAV